MLGEIRRNTWHVLRRPCKDVPILTEEINELAFLFAIEVCTDDSVPLRVLWVQWYLLCLPGRLEGSFGSRLLGIWGHVRLLADHGYNLVKEPLLGSDHKGLDQPTAGGCTGG